MVLLGFKTTGNIESEGFSINYMLETVKQGQIYPHRIVSYITRLASLYLHRIVSNNIADVDPTSSEQSIYALTTIIEL